MGGGSVILYPPISAVQTVSKWCHQHKMGPLSGIFKLHFCTVWGSRAHYLPALLSTTVSEIMININAFIWSDHQFRVYFREVLSNCNRPCAWPWLSPGEAWAKCILYSSNPHPAEGSVTPRSKSHCQSAYPLSLALVLIYVYWHAISCSITFTCQTVNQRGSALMGGNSIRITSCPHWLVYLHGDGDSGWAKDITPGISLCRHVSAGNVCASLWDVEHLNVDWVHRYSYSRGKWYIGKVILFPQSEL